MATGLDFYTRTEEHIGVSVNNPAVGADVSKAMNAIIQEFKTYHGHNPADDQIIVTADESGIFFEFRGTTGLTGTGGRE